MPARSRWVRGKPIFNRPSSLIRMSAQVGPPPMAPGPHGVGTIYPTRQTGRRPARSKGDTSEEHKHGAASRHRDKNLRRRPARTKADTFKTPRNNSVQSRSAVDSSESDMPPRTSTATGTTMSFRSLISSPSVRSVHGFTETAEAQSSALER